MSTDFQIINDLIENDPSIINNIDNIRSIMLGLEDKLTYTMRVLIMNIVSYDYVTFYKYTDIHGYCFSSLSNNELKNIGKTHEYISFDTYPRFDFNNPYMRNHIYIMDNPNIDELMAKNNEFTLKPRTDENDEKTLFSELYQHIVNTTSISYITGLIIEILHFACTIGELDLITI